MFAGRGSETGVPSFHRPLGRGQCGHPGSGRGSGVDTLGRGSGSPASPSLTLTGRPAEWESLTFRKQTSLRCRCENLVRNNGLIN